MSDSKRITAEELEESWVEICSRSGTPLPSVAEGYLRLLKEAQREGSISSAKQSIASSRIDSPKSPPNSPNTEPNTEAELRDIFINYCGSKVKEAQSEYDSWRLSLQPISKLSGSRSPPLSPNSANYEAELNKAETLLQWGVRPDQQLLMSRDYKYSPRQRISLLHPEILAPLLVTNCASLLLGIGVVYWYFRR